MPPGDYDIDKLRKSYDYECPHCNYMKDIEGGFANREPSWCTTCREIRSFVKIK